MKGKIFAGLLAVVLGLAFLNPAFASKVNDLSTRAVATLCSGMTFTIYTVSSGVYYNGFSTPASKKTRRVKVTNMDATDLVYVDFGRLPLVVTGTNDLTTVAADATITLATARATLAVGDVIVFTTGNADDGPHCITAVNSTTSFEVDPAPTVTAAGTGDYTITSAIVNVSSTREFDVQTDYIGIASNDDSDIVRVDVQYE